MSPILYFWELSGGNPESCRCQQARYQLNLATHLPTTLMDTIYWRDFDTPLHSSAKPNLPFLLSQWQKAVFRTWIRVFDVFGSGSGLRFRIKSPRAFDDQNFKNWPVKKNYKFWFKLFISLLMPPWQVFKLHRRSLQPPPPKRASSTSKHKISSRFKKYFQGSFLPSCIRIRIQRLN